MFITWLVDSDANITPVFLGHNSTIIDTGAITQTCVFLFQIQILEMFGGQISPPYHRFLGPGVGGNEYILNALSTSNDCFPLASKSINTYRGEEERL